MEKFNLLGINFEMRKAHFLESFGRTVEKMAIISFGKCNYNCPYCKRDGQFKDVEGNIIKSKKYTWDRLKTAIDSAVNKGLRIRLSGGDPCMYIEDSLHIAKYVKETYGQKISIAHNGSSMKLIKTLLPYLEYVAIDIKGHSNDAIAYRTGIRAKSAIETAMACINQCADNGVLVDIRTCVFGDTSLADLSAIRRLIAKNISRTSNVFWTLRKYNMIPSCDFAEADAGTVRDFAKKLKNEIFKVGFRDKWTGTSFEIY